MAQSAADRPEVGGVAYATRLRKGDLAPYVLLPGDPDRIPKITCYWDKFEEKGNYRQYRTATGTYQGVDISAVSTGVGGPSTEVVLDELARLGAETLIRVGTSGSIQPDIHCGDLVIDAGAVRFDGTSSLYVWPEYPAYADYDVVMALIQACEELGFSYHLGLAATTGSFFAGQARPAYDDYVAPGKEQLLEHYQRVGVTNLEMEGATLLTLARLYRKRAGMIVGIVADRINNIWSDEGVEEKVSRAATHAVKILAEWDATKKHTGKRYIYPGLLAKQSKGGKVND